MVTDFVARRRQLLAALPAGLILAALPARATVARREPPLLTCWSDSLTRPRVFRAGLLGMASRALDLPARGHDVFWHPSADGSAVVVARRPGQFMFRWDVASGRLLARFDTDDSVRLEGHITFDQAGERIFASETDLISGDGQVGVYDASSLERLDAWPSGGIGPHALKALESGRLAVANGGILTLPETGRVKRNLATMDSSLALIDPLSGAVTEQFRLPDRYMSIRHLAEARTGEIAVALQNEGGPLRPLFALLVGGSLRYGRCGAAQLKRCGTYAGDIACLDSGFAVSCSSAGVTALWGKDGVLQGIVPTPSVCALVDNGREVVATADKGYVWLVSARHPDSTGIWRHPLALDNHAVSGQR